MNKELEVIWENFYHEIHLYLFKRTGDQDLSQDVLQDVFIKINGQSDKILNAKNITQYLFGITRNTLMDHYRNEKKLNKLKDDFSNEALSLNQEAEDEDLNQTIATCCLKPLIECLPQQYQQPLIQTQLNGKSQKETASSLGIPYSSLKSQVQRGKEKLKNLLIQCSCLKLNEFGKPVPQNSSKCEC
jgi:RNA polymerase sigma-70 factor (ECF subfamily)